VLDACPAGDKMGGVTGPARAATDLFDALSVEVAAPPYAGARDDAVRRPECCGTPSLTPAPALR